MARSDYQDPSQKTVRNFLAAGYGRETARIRWHWLTWAHVLAIANPEIRSDVQQRVIAARFGVTPAAVSQIASRARAWEASRG